jgi:hypothetical protein
LAALETARQLAPDEPRVYFALGILEKREGRYPRAVEATSSRHSVGVRKITLPDLLKALATAASSSGAGSAR